jgi:1-acyl-sn-glycerol-3-phosphate acyltransferase
LFYSVCWLSGRLVFLCTMNLRVLGRKFGQRRGPYILAVSHLSHLEPAFVALLVHRQVDWIARMEFYRNPIAAWLLHLLGAIKVNRQGVPVTTIRSSLERLRRGRVVGIFPEGGVTRGQASVCNGGPIKLGACLLACRAQVPIVPVVAVGIHELMRVEPWLPFRRAYVWMAFGEPIQPMNPGRTIAERHIACREMGDRLRAAMQALHRELCEEYALGDRTGATYAESSTATSPAHRPASFEPVRGNRDARDPVAAATSSSFGTPSASAG